MGAGDNHFALAKGWDARRATDNPFALAKGLDVRCASVNYFALAKAQNGVRAAGGAQRRGSAPTLAPRRCEMNQLGMERRHM